MAKQIYTENIVNDETGEISTRRWINRKTKTTEAFLRTYLEDIGALAKCSGSEKTVIWAIYGYVEYNTNKVFIDSVRRKEISEKWGITMNTVNSAFSRLCKKNILIKESNCAFVLNPKLFFFGSDIEREKVLELVIQYQIG